MTRDANWALWRSFLAVYDEGSLTRAAAYLNMSQPTIGRHIQELESHVGQPLFIRSQLGLTPSRVAETVVPTARIMANAAMTLARQASANETGLNGTIRLSASEIVGMEILPKVLTALRDKYPTMIIELVLSNTQEDLLTRAADIAIRMTDPQQERLIRKRIGTAKLGLYAHRRYLAKRHHPKTLADLETHDLIGVDRGLARYRDYPFLGRAPTAEDFTFRCDSDLGQLAALRAGLGIGFCQSVVAQQDPDLIRLLASDVSINLPVWLVRHEDLKGDPIVDTAFDILAELLHNAYTSTG